MRSRSTQKETPMSERTCELCGAVLPTECQNRVHICAPCRECNDPVPLWLCVVQTSDRTWVELSRCEDHSDLSVLHEHIIRTLQCYLPVREYVHVRSLLQDCRIMANHAHAIVQLLPTLATQVLKPELLETTPTIEELHRDFSDPGCKDP